MSRDESIVRLDLIFDESEHIANNNKRIGIELLDNWLLPINYTAKWCVRGPTMHHIVVILIRNRR